MATLGCTSRATSSEAQVRRVSWTLIADSRLPATDDKLPVEIPRLVGCAVDTGEGSAGPVA